MTIINAEINLRNGRTISISDMVERKLVLPSFYGFGNGKTNRNNMTSINIPKVMRQLSKPAFNLFWQFVEERNRRTNIVEYIVVPEKRAWMSRTTKELMKYDLVLRLQRGQYIINPLAVLPDYPQETFDNVMEQWEVALKKQK